MKYQSTCTKCGEEYTGGHMWFCPDCDYMNACNNEEYRKDYQDQYE